MSKKKSTKITLDIDLTSMALPTSSTDVYETKGNRYVAPRSTRQDGDGDSSYYSDKPRGDRPMRQDRPFRSDGGFSREGFGLESSSRYKSETSFSRDNFGSESTFSRSYKSESNFNRDNFASGDSRPSKPETTFSRDAFGTADPIVPQPKSDSSSTRSSKYEGGFSRGSFGSNKPESSFSRDSFGTAEATSSKSKNWTERTPSSRAASNDVVFSRDIFGTAEQPKPESTFEKKSFTKASKNGKQAPPPTQVPETKEKNLKSIGQASQFAILDDSEDEELNPEEIKRKAEEEAKRKADEAKRKAEAEAKRKAEEEEAKRKAEEEAKHKAEEEARRKAEEEARRKAEEEARRKAEEEAKRKAEEEAKRKAEEEEAQRKAEEEAQRKAAYPDIPESKQGAFYQALFVEHTAVSFGQLKKSINDYFPLHPATRKALAHVLALSIHEAMFNIRYLITNLSKLFATCAVAVAKKAGETDLDNVRAQAIRDCLDIITAGLAVYATTFGDSALCDLIKSENDEKLLEDLKPASEDLNTWLKNSGLDMLISKDNDSHNTLSTFDAAAKTAKSTESIDVFAQALLSAASFKDSKTALTELSDVLRTKITPGVIQQFLQHLFEYWGKKYSKDTQLIKSIAADLIEGKYITFQDLAAWRDDKSIANAYKANALLAVGYWINVNAPVQVKVIEHQYADDEEINEE